MAVDVTLAKLGLTMESAVLDSWHKSVGESVAEGEVIAEIETEKVTSEVKAPTSGVLSEILLEEGEEADVGSVIARIEPN